MPACQPGLLQPLTCAARAEPSRARCRVGIRAHMVAPMDGLTWDSLEASRGSPRAYLERHQLAVYVCVMTVTSNGRTDPGPRVRWLVHTGLAVHSLYGVQRTEWSQRPSIPGGTHGYGRVAMCGACKCLDFRHAGGGCRVPRTAQLEHSNAATKPVWGHDRLPARFSRLCT